MNFFIQQGLIDDTAEAVNKGNLLFKVKRQITIEDGNVIGGDVINTC